MSQKIFVLALVVVVGVTMFLQFSDLVIIVHEALFDLKNAVFSRNEKDPPSLPKYKDYNVILISLDTLRADRLGCYGYSRNTSPNIDMFANRSLVFKNTFSNAYNTLPSHMSIFSGLYPPTHKMNFYGGPALSPDFLTLPQILKRHGYQTIWNGPLYTSALDLKKGFEKGIDSFYDSCFSTTEGYELQRFEQILETIDSKFYLFIHSYLNHTPYYYPFHFDSTFINASYNGRLPKNFSACTDKLFLYIQNDYKKKFSEFNYKTRTLPSHLKSELINMVRSNNRDDFSKMVFRLQGDPGLPEDYRISFFFPNIIIRNPTSADISELNNRYDNGVFYVDYVFQKILLALKEKGLLEKTIIIITSDHGEELYEHKAFDHNSFYDHTIQTPLIIKIPGLDKKVEINTLAQSIDIMPMLLSLLGIKAPGYLQGKNLLAQHDNQNTYVFGYSFGAMYARSDRWKYIVNNDGTEELYHLPSDAGEQNNLVNTRSMFAKKQKVKMKRALDLWLLKQF